MMPYELGYLQPGASMFQLWGIYRIDNIFGVVSMSALYDCHG
jgi:hypothetical protein